MKRILITALSSALLFSLPALAGADEAKAEVKAGSDGSSSTKTSTEHTRADGKKVKKETKHEVNADGTGASKSETTVTDPATGAESKTTKKTKKSKSLLTGKTETKTETTKTDSN